MILAIVILRDQLDAVPGKAWAALVALAVTVGTHFATRRNTLASITVGTACYVVLINFF